MKFTIILSLLMFAGFAQADAFEQTDPGVNKSLWPRITASRNGVDVHINNYTQHDYRCSGSINITHASGRTTYEYYSARVYSRFTHSRYFWNRRHDDPIVRAYDSIHCYRL